MFTRARFGFVSAAIGLACAAPACGGNRGTTPAGGTGGAGSGASSTTTQSTGIGGASASTSSTTSSGNGWCASQGTGGTCGSSSSSSGTTAGVVFTVDLCAGPARQFDPPATPQAVPDYVYGINAGAFVATTTKFGMIRQGGDDNSAYNWTNDYSNSGADFCYYQGGSTKDGNLAGRYTDPMGDTIPAAQAKGEAFLATVPILDYVAATYGRNTGWDTATNAGDVCPGPDPLCSMRSGQLSANVVDKSQGDPGFGETLTFAYANDGTSTPTGSAAFIANTMSKGSAFCSCAPGTTTCAGCTVGLNPVAQDEFVNFLKVNYASGGAPVFFDLDNEPNYWVGTHPELYPNTCSTGSVPWDDTVARNISAATAIKKAWSTAKVFGPVVSGDGMAYGGDYDSPDFVAGTEEYSDYYLQKLAAASVAAGEQLIDSFDVHYYTVGTTDAECLESPRLFWDPNATDISAAETNSLDFNYGDHSYWDMYWYPRQTIPRLQRKVSAAYTGKATPAPGLSFSEYNPGCETAISGGVAEADLLGIFGREGVFAATAWPLQSATENYLVAAYDLYRNYDGNGSTVGDTTVRATTSDTKDTSVYAFTHSDEVTAVELVAINKLATAQPVTIQIASAPALHTATLYNLVTGAPAVAPATGAAPAVTCACNACSLTFTMPATSATTVVLR
jgi:Glycoside hydrolase family 44